MSTSAAESTADVILKEYFTFLSKLRNSFNDPAEGIPVEDVVLASSFASGSNLTQHMVYQILVAANRVPTDPDGSDYIDTTEVVPVSELRNFMKLKEPHHRSDPQVWKTHLVMTPFQKYEGYEQRKYIYCIRNPLEVCRSFLDFSGEWFTGMSLSDPAVREVIYPRYFMEYFLEAQRLPDGSYPKSFERPSLWFRHVKTWTENDVGNTLYLIYEDIIENFPSTISTVAKFVGVQLSEDHLEQVASRCDRSWMANNPRMKAHVLSKCYGLNVEKSSRTRRLDSLSFRDIELPVFCKEACWNMFHDAIGIRTYEELVDGLRKRNQKLLAGKRFA